MRNTFTQREQKGRRWRRWRRSTYHLEQDVHRKTQQQAALLGGAAVEHLHGEVGGSQHVETLVRVLVGGLELHLDGEEGALQEEGHLLDHVGDALADHGAAAMEGALDGLEHLAALAQRSDARWLDLDAQVRVEVHVLLEHVANLVREFHSLHDA